MGEFCNLLFSIVLHSRPTASAWHWSTCTGSIWESTGRQKEDLYQSNYKQIRFTQYLVMLQFITFQDCLFWAAQKKETTDKELQDPQENTKIPNVQPMTILFFCDISCIPYDQVQQMLLLLHSPGLVVLLWCWKLFSTVMWAFSSQTGFYEFLAAFTLLQAPCGIKQSCSLNSKFIFWHLVENGDWCFPPLGDCTNHNKLQTSWKPENRKVILTNKLWHELTEAAQEHTCFFITVQWIQVCHQEGFHTQELVFHQTIGRNRDTHLRCGHTKVDLM